VTAVEAGIDIHHGAPGCLLGLFDAATGGLVDCSEFDAEDGLWGVEVRGLSREDLSALMRALPARSLPPSIAGCTRKPAPSCGGGDEGALEPWLSTAGRTSRCLPASDGGTSH
jgi:hypothetical protein